MQALASLAFALAILAACLTLRGMVARNGEARARALRLGLCIAAIAIACALPPLALAACHAHA